MIFAVKLLVLSFLVSFSSYSAVWPVTRSWTENSENEYSHWVQKNWTNDIFTNPGSDLFGLKTDCADASYAMRAYYAFQNGLPVYFHGYGGQRVDQSMTQFDYISDPLNRFRAYLNFLFDATSTHTLSRDTYPVAIDRSEVRAGIVYVSPGIHSYQIIGLDEFGIPETLSSTVPREERLLFFHHGFPFYIPSDEKKFEDGFRAFKNGSPQSESRQQYEIGKQAGDDFIRYQSLMIKKLSKKTEPFERKIKRIKNNLCFFSRERAVLVADAFVAHKAQSNKCFAPGPFDDYSTYIRDRKLKYYFNEFKSMTKEKEWQNTKKETKEILLSTFLTEIPDNECTVETSLPLKPILRLSEIYKTIEENKLVSDPNATMAQRWGLEPYQPECPIY
jgi:hypothetical protein